MQRPLAKSFLRTLLAVRFRAHTPLPSLRLWLQSTALLAVVAGYATLYAFSSLLSDDERANRHLRLVLMLQRELDSGAVALPLPKGFGIQARWVPSQAAQPPLMVRESDGSAWMRSVTPGVGVDPGPSALEVRHNITASLERQRRDQLLLVAAAGASVLLTSVLLRLVIWRGLLQPLASLSAELDVLRASNLAKVPIDPEGQPQELRPIVEAANGLQDRLARAWAQERSFVDGAAHELRTPVTVISSHAQRLQALGDARSRDAIACIVQESERMGRLISSLLDLARDQASRLQLRQQRLDPEALLLDSFERLQPLAPQRLRLADASRNDVGSLWLDPDRLHQSLAALVENALLYSSDTVELSVVQSADLIAFHVLDRGPGIAADERAQVLERFARGRAAIGTRGSGIGLAMVTVLMAAMGGTLSIHDRVGGGADLALCFRVAARPPER